jgi:PAS domain S-box-containing protein
LTKTAQKQNQKDNDAMESRGQRIYSLGKRSVFVLSLLLSFAIIFGAAGIVAYKSYTKAIDATIRSNETKANLLAKLILEHQRAAIGVLRSYAGRPLLVQSVKRNDFEEALKHLTDLAKHNPEMDWPFIANPDSTVWVNYPVDRLVMNKDLSYRDWYKGVSKEWKPYISSVYKLIVGQKDLAVAVSTPILDEKGKVIGILATAQSTTFFREIVSEVGLSLDAKISLVDQEGHIIYSNGFPYTKEVIGYPSYQFVKRAIKGEKGSTEVRDPSDRDRIHYVSFALLEGIGWSILVEKTKSEVLRSEYSSLVMVGVISLLIYGVIVLSLVHLRDRHRRIKELEELNEKLDGRVRERTTELEAGYVALRESEERLRFALETIHTGAWDLNLLDHSAFRSLEHDRIFGYDQLLPEWTYEKFLEHVIPEDRPTVDGKFRRAMENQSDWNFECRIGRTDGRVRWIWAAGRHTQDAAGTPRRMAGIVQDITERKQAEQALKESENRLRRFYESGLLGVIYWNMNGEITNANDKFLEMVGYDREDLAAGRIDWNGLTPPDYRHLDESSVAELKAIGMNKTPLEKEYIRKDGSRLPIIIAGAMLDEARFNGVAFVLDITERKRLEEERGRLLAQVENRAAELDATISSMATGLIVYNAAGQAIRMNNTAKEMLPAELFFNMTVEERARVIRWETEEGRPFPPEEIPVARALRGETTYNVVLSASFPDRILWISASAAPIRASDGKVLGVVASFVDITERKRAEVLLQQHTSELQHLTATLEERVRERTVELEDLSARLVSAQEDERRRISYDLHDNAWQALVAIRFEMERLFSNREGMDQVALQDRSKKVLAALLEAVGKIRSMQGDLWPYVLDDIGILATIDWYCREFEKNHPGLTIERQDGLVEHEIPPSAKIVIYRILQETLNNVAKHSQASRVTLRLQKNDHGMEFTVEDNGLGFDPEEVMVKRSPWGGLGLLNIKARTELSGGLFGVESVRGKGTVVRASWSLQEKGETPRIERRNTYVKRIAG